MNSFWAVGIAVACSTCLSVVQAGAQPAPFQTPAATAAPSVDPPISGAAASPNGAVAQAEVATPADRYCTPGTSLTPDAFDVWKAPATGEVKKIALVMGNDYETAPPNGTVKPLKRARTDARLMYNVLTAKGFQVVCILDARLSDIYSAITNISSELIRQHNSNADQELQSVIYFAGHGGEDKQNDPKILPADFADLVVGNLPYVAVSVLNLLSYLPDGFTSGDAPIVIIDACRSQIDGLSPFNQSAKRTPTGTEPVYDLIFTTSQGMTAGDGTFVDSLETLLNNESWTSVVDPVLADVVGDVKSISPLREANQTPVGPLTSIGSLEEYLWLPDDSKSADGYLWVYGVSESYERHNYFTSGCIFLRGVVSQLYSPSIWQSDWAPMALSKIAPIFKDVCHQAPPPPPGALNARSAGFSGSNRSVRLGFHHLYLTGGGTPKAAPILTYVSDTAADGTQSRSRFHSANPSRPNRAARVACGPATAIGAMAQAGFSTRSQANQWSPNIITFAVQLSLSGTISEVERTRLSSELLDGKKSQVNRVHLRIVSTNCDDPITPRAIMSMEQLRAVIAQQLSLSVDAVDYPTALSTDWISRSECLAHSVYGLCILIGLDH